MRTTVLRKIKTLIAVPSAGAVAAICLSLSLCLLLAGCSTLEANTRPHFHGTDQASVVLQYNSPDYIFMTKPSCREEKFLRQIRRPEVVGLLDDMRVPRETAVVAVSWLYEGEMLEAILCDWKDLLKQCGFRQAVFVRGTNSTSVEGAVIIAVNDLRATPVAP